MKNCTQNTLPKAKNKHADLSLFYMKKGTLQIGKVPFLCFETTASAHFASGVIDILVKL